MKWQVVLLGPALLLLSLSGCVDNKSPAMNETLPSILSMTGCPEPTLEYAFEYCKDHSVGLESTTLDGSWYCTTAYHKMRILYEPTTDRHAFEWGPRKGNATENVIWFANENEQYIFRWPATDATQTVVLPFQVAADMEYKLLEVAYFYDLPVAFEESEIVRNWNLIEIPADSKWDGPVELGLIHEVPVDDQILRFVNDGPHEETLDSLGAGRVQGNFSEGNMLIRFLKFDGVGGTLESDPVIPSRSCAVSGSE